MVMNDSMNERILENYYYNLYGFNINYEAYEDRGNRFQVRLSTSVLGSLIYLLAKGENRYL